MSNLITGSNPAKTVRELAAALNRLADEMEDQHEGQSDLFGAALGNAELGIANQIDELATRQTLLDARIAALERRDADGD